MNRPVTQAEINYLKKAIRELRKDYNANALVEAKNDYVAKQQQFETYKNTLKQNAGYTNNAVTLPQDIKSSSESYALFSTKPAPNSTDSAPETNFRNSKKNYQKIAIIFVFANETDKRSEYEIIANYLNVGNKTLADYLAQNETLPESTKVEAIKNALLALIDDIVNQKF